MLMGTFLFRIGRLNVGLECVSEGWYTDQNIVKSGDTIIVTHIPGGEKLDVDNALAAIDEAEEFFLKYFPEKSIKCFVCASWFLDTTLDNFLKKESNIIEFRNLFISYMKKEHYGAIVFAFAKNVTKENLSEYVPKNSFQEKLKAHILNDGKLYTGFVYRPLNNK